MPVPSPGRYVFMVQYHSDETPSVQELEVDVTTRSQSVQGRLLLPGCPYSALCRRAVADAQGETLVVDVDGTHASMTLMGRANIDVAIVSLLYDLFDTKLIFGEITLFFYSMNFTTA